MLHRWGRIYGAHLKDAKSVYLSWKDGITKSKNFRLTKSYSRPVLFGIQGLSFPSVKLGEHSIEKLQIWNILRWLGLNHCRILVFRRKLKRFSYPWLSYSLPAGVILALGDLIAQYHLAPHPAERTISQFFSKDWIKERTLVYALLGFFLVGPVLSKWNLFLYRKLGCKASQYLIMKTLLDLLILSPILLTLMAVIFDQRYGINIFTDPLEKTKGCFECKYIPSVTEMMKFNLITRPIMALAMCYVIPIQYRKSFRCVYETVFASYLSDSFYRHKLRFPPPPPPPPPPPEPKKSSDKKPPPKRAFKWPC